jgi:hypothetical protein
VRIEPCASSYKGCCQPFPGKLPDPTNMKNRIVLPVTAALILMLSLLAAGRRLLWLDEIFTFYVSAQPTVRETVAALLAGFDVHPPIDFMLRHLSMAAFGRSEIAFRLPSVVAMLIGLLAMYAFARRRVPAVPALAAFAMPLSTFAADYAYEGRPYALLFASAALVLLAWQRAIDRPHSLSRQAVLAAALCLGPFSHYFGVLNYLPVLAGESWRAYVTRRISWPIVFAVLASAATLPLLWLFARSAAELGRGSYPEPSVLAMVFSYSTLVGAAAIPLLAGLIGAFALQALGLERSKSAASPEATVPSHEILAAVTLSLTPVWGLALAELVDAQLLDRYLIATLVGLALLCADALAKLQRYAPRATAAAIVALIVSGLGALATDARGSKPTAVPTAVRSLLTEDGPPVVVDNQHVFVQYWQYLPQAERDRLFYVVDESAGGTGNLPEKLGQSVQHLAALVPMQAPSYAEFISQHPDFYVVMSATGTLELLPSLLRDHVCLQLVATFEGKQLLRARIASSTVGECMQATPVL